MTEWFANLFHSTFVTKKITALDTITYETMMICKKITCTECKTAQDIIPFLRKYKEMNLKVDKDLSDAEWNQRETIQKYDDINLFYYDDIKVMEKEKVLSFLTFHWALHTLGKKNLPYYYTKVQDASNIYNDENWEYIEKYRKIVKEANI